MSNSGGLLTQVRSKIADFSNFLAYHLQDLSDWSDAELWEESYDADADRAHWNELERKQVAIREQTAAALRETDRVFHSNAAALRQVYEQALASIRRARAAKASELQSWQYLQIANLANPNWQGQGVPAPLATVNFDLSMRHEDEERLAPGASTATFASPPDISDSQSTTSSPQA